MLPVNRLISFVSQNQLFDANSSILAAVSGGRDSVLMVRLLHAAGYRFAIAHCNFQLRGAEADADQHFCRQLADELSAPFHIINFDTETYAADNKISIQMAARQLRYNWFQQLCQQYGYHAVALAHHHNDAIETILLNLTRGTGIAGLHGILPKNGNLVRPLLFLHRDEIDRIFVDNNLAHREDSSNSSAKYARNKIRLEVAPKLRELNPALERTFEGNLQHFRQLEVLLRKETDKLRDELNTLPNGDVEIPLELVKNLTPQQLLLYSLLEPYGFNSTQVDDVISTLDKHSGRQFKSAGYTLILDRERLLISTDGDEPTATTIAEGDHSVTYGNYRFTLLHDDSPLIIKNNPKAASVDAALIQFPLTLRSWQQGDYFFPLGMRGKQKLSDYFVQQKIPLHQKSQVPVLVNGNGEIIWLSGYLLDNRYKVTAKTEKVIIFELEQKP